MTDNADPEKRNWVPNQDAIADELIQGYHDGGPEVGNIDAIATLDSWQSSARLHGDEFTEDDWIALVQELAWRAAFPSAP